MTKEEALAYKEGDVAVKALEIEELRLMSDAETLSHLAALMASVDQSAWQEALPADEEQVKGLWARLRRAYVH